MEQEIKKEIVITDEYLLERGYKEYKPTRFDNESVVARFQKRFDDDFGKKYFIDVIKWSNDYVPVARRDKWWKPFSYHYETQVTMFEDQKALNMEFFSAWSLEEVEVFMKKMFHTMNLNYYETWTENRGVPQEEVSKTKMENEEKTSKALDIAFRYGQIDGGHHKAWVIDQMVRALCGSDEEYQKWVKEYCGPDPETGDEYLWDTGINP